MQSFWVPLICLDSVILYDYILHISLPFMKYTYMYIELPLIINDIYQGECVDGII